ncbi:hypothetical protein FI667_g12952, partial [Globisporangium splendens]
MSLQQGFSSQVSLPPALSSLVHTTVLKSGEVSLAASPLDCDRAFETSLLLSESRPNEKGARLKLHDDCLEILDISISIPATHSDLRSPLKEETEADSTPLRFGELIESIAENQCCGVEYAIPPSTANQQPSDGSTFSEAISRYDPDTQCRYRNGKCAQLRTYKKNGALHTLCEWHRAKSCVNQKAFDSKKRQRFSKSVVPRKTSRSKSQCNPRQPAKRPQDTAKPNKTRKGTRRSRRLEASPLYRGDGGEDFFQAFTLVLDPNQLLQLQVPALTQFLMAWPLQSISSMDSLSI